MNKRTTLLLISLTLILVLSACKLGGAENYETGDPAKQPVNPEAVPTPTPEPSPAILANTGSHTYSVTATPLTCELTLTYPEQLIEIQFVGTTAVITHPELDTSETYGIAGDDRYSRINDTLKTIVIEFSVDGFQLSIFDPESDPHVDEPCGYFTYTLAGD